MKQNRFLKTSKDTWQISYTFALTAASSFTCHSQHHHGSCLLNRGRPWILSCKKMPTWAQHLHATSATARILKVGERHGRFTNCQERPPSRTWEEWHGVRNAQSQSSAARTQEQVHVASPAHTISSSSFWIGVSQESFGERRCQHGCNICMQHLRRPLDSGPVVVWGGGCHDKISNGREEWYVVHNARVQFELDFPANRR